MGENQSQLEHNIQKRLPTKILIPLAVTMFVLILLFPDIFLNPSAVIQILMGTFAAGMISLYVVILIDKKIFKGAPYVRTHKKTLERMVEMAAIKPGDFTVDIGSGDGEIVIAFAKNGAKAHGYEINPLLYIWSVFRAKHHGVQNTVMLSKNNFWNVNFSSFDVVTVYGISYMMPALEKKLKTELKSGARVISNSFKFPNWEHKKQMMDVFLYIKE